MKITYEAEFITRDHGKGKVEAPTPIEAGSLALERGATGIRVCQVIRVEYNNRGAGLIDHNIVTVDNLDRPIKPISVRLDDIPQLIGTLATIYTSVKGEA